MEKISAKVKTLVTKAESMPTEFKEYAVNTLPQHQAAATFLKEVSTQRRELEGERKKITQPLDESKRRVMDFFRLPLSALSQAESIIKRAMITFQNKEEAARKEQERKLREQARREEERKRKALDKKIETAQKNGKEEKAADLLEQKADVHVPVPVVPTVAEHRTPGVTKKTIWKFRVLDKNKIPVEYMIPDEKTIGELVRATKGTLEIPGVKIYPETIIAA